MNELNKRKHPRVPVNNMTVDVSDGIGFFSGNVSDISRFGICLANVAKRLGTNQEKLTVVVTGRGKHFKFKVSPKWELEDTFGKKIGAAIDNVPWQWTEFVIKCGEPAETDGWGKGD